MPTKIVKGFALNEEDINALNAITEMTSMNNSEVIRYLIKKCINDKTEMQIIMQNFLDTEGERVGVKRKLRIMSDRTKIKKSCATQRTQDPAVSSNCLSYSNQETTNNQPHDQLEDMTPEELRAAVDQMMKDLYPEED